MRRYFESALRHLRSELRCFPTMVGLWKRSRRKKNDPWDGSKWESSIFFNSEDN